MATGGGEEAKNVQVKKKEERTYEGREEDIEHFVETSWGRFPRDLRSSWGPVANELPWWRRW
jgi:hypothetical protein